jgi:hypothetical protein
MDSDSEHSRSEETTWSETLGGQKRKDSMDASCDHALNEDNIVGQKSGEFPCGEDVTVMEGTNKGMRKGNRETENLGADGGVELSSFTNESDL